ncbi:aldehyde dehydrogenase [Peptostreptococcus faecalis]|uniref:aldehyde dehydrogenase n=1 Tax=Peptostreptococcus faecalis TaxID=2045015 RepID=UPI002E8E1027|nr:aldehyde dehydrogenase [Peptostreptococcus faecalis]
MTEKVNIQDLVEKQRKFYKEGNTLDYIFRLNSLKKLHEAIKNNEYKIYEALEQDLHKSEFESYMTEIGIVLEEIRTHINNLSKWMKDKKVISPISQFPSKSFIHSEPFGVCLIMSPWNYPFQLTMAPLIGAISGGNCAVLKPSAYSRKTSELIKNIIEKIFPPEYISVVLGSREENSELLNQKFDFIFFTGSINVGKLVMKKASDNLTPLILELGGKSPVIIDDTADISLSAKRVAFGKCVNAGQTCIAPDYVFVKKNKKEEFINEYKKNINEFFPNNDYKDFPKIINEKHFNRIKSLIDKEKVIFGGEYSDSTMSIFPTLVEENDLNSPVMSEEIFGPILPIITYEKIEECIDYINSKSKPLALYLFTNDKYTEKRIIQSCSFGGGCVNDTIVHFADSKIGFGGVGESGMGRYHGENSFDAFTHKKGILKKSNILDLKMRYHPYNKKKLDLIKKFLK